MSDFLRKHLGNNGRRNGIAILAGVLAIGSVLGFQVWQRDSLPAGAAFKVGDHVVTEKDVDRRTAVLRALYGVEVPSDPDEEDQFWRDAAQSMALGLVIEDAAQQMEVAVPEREAKKALSDYVVQYFGEGTEGRDAFIAAMAGQGTSEAEVLAEVRRHLLLNALFDRRTGEVAAPTTKEVRTAFQERKCLLDTPEQRQLSNIVLSSEDDAAELFAVLQGGADFSETARTRSLDSSTAQEGGDLGTVAAADLESGYAKAAFAAEVGEAFGPVKSSHGWNIGMVKAVEPPQEATFEEVQTELAQLLQYERRAEVWQDWLQSGLNEAGVVYAEKYQPDDALALPETMSDPDGAGVAGEICATTP